MKLVEVLVVDGCPNLAPAVEHVREEIARSKVPADVRIVHVHGDDDAQRLRFLGSPTVRVDGHDVDPTAEGRTDFGVQCRVYAIEGRYAGSPTVESIAAALTA